MMPGTRLMYQSVFVPVFCLKHMDCTSALCGFRHRVSLKIPTASRDAGFQLIASLCQIKLNAVGMFQGMFMDLMTQSSKNQACLLVRFSHIYFYFIPSPNASAVLYILQHGFNLSIPYICMAYISGFQACPYSAASHYVPGLTTYKTKSCQQSGAQYSGAWGELQLFHLVKNKTSL